jgi:chromosome segregation ATPase
MNNNNQEWARLRSEIELLKSRLMGAESLRKEISTLQKCVKDLVEDNVEIQTRLQESKFNRADFRSLQRNVQELQENNFVLRKRINELESRPTSNKNYDHLFSHSKNKLNGNRRLAQVSPLIVSVIKYVPRCQYVMNPHS